MDPQNQTDQQPTFQNPQTENTETQAPVEVKKPKSNFLSLLLILLLLLLISVTTYLGYQNWQLQQQIKNYEKIIKTETPSSVNSIDKWETFVDKQSIYSIQYPFGWRVEDITALQTLDDLESDVVIKSPEVTDQTIVTEGTKIRIIVADEKSDIYRIDPLGEYPTPPSETGEGKMISEESINLNGDTGVKRKFDNILGYGLDYSHTLIGFNNNGLNLILSCHTPKNDSSLCDQILSTFEFTN